MATYESEANKHQFKVIQKGLTATTEAVSGGVKQTISGLIIEETDGNKTPETGKLLPGAALNPTGPYF